MILFVFGHLRVQSRVSIAGPIYYTASISISSETHLSPLAKKQELDLKVLLAFALTAGRFLWFFALLWVARFVASARCSASYSSMYLLYLGSSVPISSSYTHQYFISLTALESQIQHSTLTNQTRIQHLPLCCPRFPFPFNTYLPKPPKART